MKKLLGLLLAVCVTSVFAEAEVKKVCHNEEKNGKTVEVCKTIKVHKKLDETPVPTKK